MLHFNEKTREKKLTKMLVMMLDCWMMIVMMMTMLTMVMIMMKMAMTWKSLPMTRRAKLEVKGSATIII